MLDDMLWDRRKKLQALKDGGRPSNDGAAPPSIVSVKEISTGSQSPPVLEKEDDRKPNAPIPKVADYSRLDVEKAKRLINARESSIKSVNALIGKEEERQRS
jgi:hypothetical protein